MITRCPPSLIHAFFIILLICATILSGYVLLRSMLRQLFRLSVTCNGAVGSQMALPPVVVAGHSVADTAWTPLVPNSGGLYMAEVVDVRVNNRSIGVPPTVYNSWEGAIADSGTQDVQIPRLASKALKASFGVVCSTTCLDGAGVC